MSRRLIINGDDFGLTDGVSTAILDGLGEGWLSSTSVMVRAVGAESRVRPVAQKLRPCAGVHLQIKGSRPHPPRSIPTSEPRESVVFPPKYEIEGVDPHQVKREWDTQIAFAQELGLAPTHLDTHHAVHLDPRILDVYLSLAQKYKLPIRGDSGWIAARMKEFGIRGSTCVIRNWTGTGGNFETLLHELDLSLARCGEDEIIEIVSHPAYVDDNLRQISSLNDARAADVVGLQRLIASGELMKRAIELRSFSTAFD